jgi:hypothetical protein
MSRRVRGRRDKGQGGKNDFQSLAGFAAFTISEPLLWDRTAYPVLHFHGSGR